MFAAPSGPVKKDAGNPVGVGVGCGVGVGSDGGGDEVGGAGAGAVTTAVWALVALAEPTEFLAVTRTRTVEPTSPGPSGYLVVVAPATTLQFEPAPSQRSH